MAPDGSIPEQIVQPPVLEHLPVELPPTGGLAVDEWDDGWAVKRITHFRQFMDFLEQIHEVGGTSAYAFRGQACARWHIVPTLARLAKLKNWSHEQTIRLERQALYEFKQAAHQHSKVARNTRKASPPFWWNLMQHHGAPTRLIDWTDSIYVAAYFAASQREDVDGAIYAVHVNRTGQAFEKVYGEFAETESELLDEQAKPPRISFRRTPMMTERMSMQQGFFSVSRSPIIDYTSLLPQILPDEPPRIFRLKMIISANQKRQFMQRLRAMNVTARTLFPGTDGLGRSLGEWLRSL